MTTLRDTTEDFQKMTIIQTTAYLKGEMTKQEFEDICEETLQEHIEEVKERIIG